MVLKLINRRKKVPILDHPKKQAGKVGDANLPKEDGGDDNYLCPMERGARKKHFKNRKDFGRGGLKKVGEREEGTCLKTWGRSRVGKSRRNIKRGLGTVSVKQLKTRPEGGGLKTGPEAGTFFRGGVLSHIQFRGEGREDRRRKQFKD